MIFQIMWDVTKEVFRKKYLSLNGYINKNFKRNQTTKLKNQKKNNKVNKGKQQDGIDKDNKETDELINKFVL